MTAKWELYVLEYARSRNQPVASLIQGAFDEGVMNVPFAFVLARNGKRNVLIDSGFMNKGGGAEMATKFDIPWWISPVRLLGPLGNAFGVSGLPRGEKAAIVAGGIGAAPFPLLLKALRSAGVPCDLYLGGRNARELSIRARFDGLVRGETVLASDDGSLGEKGFVTEALARRLDAGSRYARVYACGPMPMFASLAKVGEKAGIPAEFSTEAEMGCGSGACLGCVIPGTEKPFIVSCSEGPILAPEKIAW